MESVGGGRLDDGVHKKSFCLAHNNFEKVFVCFAKESRRVSLNNVTPGNGIMASAFVS